jgi:hypothetical protein
MTSRFRFGRSIVSVHHRRAVSEVHTHEEARRIAAAVLEQHGPHGVHDLLGGMGSRWGEDDDASANEQLVEQLLDGRFVLVADDHAPRSLAAPHQPKWLSELADRPLLDGPGGQEPRPPRVPEPTFVAFALLDDDGEPVREQPFSITLPDGRTIEGVTDAAGRFSVEPVRQPGRCTVRFEELVG